MAIETFKRYENKYRVDQRTWETLQGQLLDRMEPDAYNRNGRTYTISNLYYDTPDSHLIRTSLQKPVYKEKLRLRAYGVPGLETQVYLEIKKKYQGIVNKRRSAMILCDAYDFVASGQLPVERPFQNRQVLREITYLLQQHDLRPCLYLAYDRLAFFDRENRDVRISYDTNIRSRRADLRLESGDHGELMLEPGQGLIEIKVASNMPLWLARLLSDLEIRPTSFSKYGTEYQLQLAQTAPRSSIAYAAGQPSAAAVYQLGR